MFELPIDIIQPSQLFISDGKLRLINEWFDSTDKSRFDPIPVKLYNNRYLMTDGHTRAAAAILAGWETVPVTWDDDPLDMLAYAIHVRWCAEEGIKSAIDLAKRVVSHKEYEILWHKRCLDIEIPLSYAAVVARLGGLDGRHNVIVLTDNAMLETARLIQIESVPFVKNIEIINLDETADFSKIYSLSPNDLLILHISIDSWTGKHQKIACAFEKPEGVFAKYICIRPSITAKALLEGVNTPFEIIENMIRQYGDFPNEKPINISAKSGTNISLIPYEPYTIPYTTHEPGANAYLPPAEISYSVSAGSANGIIVVDVTVGELRVQADMIDPFGLVDEPVSLHIQNGSIVNISGGKMAQRLKKELWKLPECCRMLAELGFGLSDISPSGIIGIDESIAGTCHFGFGSGSGNDAPIHLDVVISDFRID